MEGQLAECISASVDPTVPAAQRRLALEAFNGFKENLASIDAALNLCRNPPSDHVRHGALVLIEHWVRVHWNNLSTEQHTLLKNEAFSYLSGLRCILSESPHVKQAICRLVVEIVKREWPQKWPDFVPNLLLVANGGMAQREIVLLVLLRLVEDVVQLKTLDEAPRRRKEIYQSIIGVLPLLMSFFFDTLNANYIVSQPTPPELLKSRVKLLESLLTTLTCFIEFVQFKDFPLDDVIRMLCVLLNDPELRIPAARCLSELPDRKLKVPDLEQLCKKFLQTEVMDDILRSAEGSLIADTSENHAFLLALCGIIAGIAKQVSLYIMEVPKFECSQASFFKLVAAVNKLCQHPSCAVARVALGAMTSLLRIQQKNPEKLVYPDELWLDITSTIISRLSFNDFSNSNWDFEEESELKKAFGFFKTELSELLRVATAVQPRIVLSQVGLGRLSDLLQKPPDEQEWSAISKFFDVACSTVVKENIDLGDGVQQLMAAYDRVLPTRFPDISCQHHAISCCSSMLTVIVPKDPEDARLGNMLDAIFWMAAFEKPGETRQTRSMDVRDFRKHGTALLVRVALDFHERLVKHFDKIRSLTVQNLSSDSTSTLERQHYVETLIILSNGLNDPAAQLAISEQVLANEIAFFTDDATLQEALSDVQNFAKFLGLLSVEDFERNSDHRVVFSGKLMAITGALKRCKTVAGHHVVFELITRTCLNRILKTLWLFKELFAQSIVHTDLVQSILCLGENDKYMIFGSNLPSCDFPSPRVPAARTFMTNFQDNLIVFFVAISYRPEFYSIRPDMGTIIINGFQNLPNYKMHQYLHLVVKCFVKNCPENLLLPQLSSTFIPMMSMIFGYLKQRWDSQSSLSKAEETGATLEELIEDRVTHLISVDLIEIASHFVIDSTNSVKTGEEVGADTVPAVKSFGNLLLADENACCCVVTIAFSALYAADSQTSFKSIALCSTLAFHLVQLQRSRMTDDLCVLMYKSLLLALRMHGDDEAQVPPLLTLGMNLYKWLAPCAGPRLRELLLSCGARGDLVEKFETTFASEVTVSVRKRRDAFRAMVEHFLGTSVSEMGKQQVQIKDQEPIWTMPKPEMDATDFLNTNILGL